jgi:hypothetical protein
MAVSARQVHVPDTVQYTADFTLDVAGLVPRHHILTDAPVTVIDRSLFQGFWGHAADMQVTLKLKLERQPDTDTAFLLLSILSGTPPRVMLRAVLLLLVLRVTWADVTTLTSDQIPLCNTTYGLRLLAKQLQVRSSRVS